MFEEILLVIVLNCRTTDDGETTEVCECVFMCVQVWVLRERRYMKECKKPRQRLSVRNCQILEKLQFCVLQFINRKQPLLHNHLNCFFALILQTPPFYYILHISFFKKAVANLQTLYQFLPSGDNDELSLRNELRRCQCIIFWMWILKSF